jgi:hypothetical protein
VAKKLVNVVYKVDDKEVLRLKKNLVDSEKEAKDLSNQLKRTGDEANKAGKQGGDSFMDFNNVLKAISIAAITHQVISFAKEVINVRGEFEKFEAVLTNTLGSRSRALIALANIQKFAMSTPFSVSELTENFIKLANRGVEPTVDQMRAIADLSATLGKPFEQVVEAILDVNNPERWKEIGVKAETAGNKVTLSFRGVNVEVDRTIKGVTDAVVELGKLNGVAGSTEAISATLAGQMSNLGDAWEQFLNTVGRGNKGVLAETIGLLSRAIDLATEMVKSNEQRFEEISNAVLSKEIENFKEFSKGFATAEEALTAFDAKIQENIKRIDDEAQKQKELANQKLGFFERDDLAKQKEISNAREKLKWLNTEWSTYKNDVIPAIREYLKAIEDKAAADLAAAEAAKKKAAADAAAKKHQQDVKDAIKFFMGLKDSDLGELDLFPDPYASMRKALEDDTERTEELLEQRYDREFDMYMEHLNEKLEAQREAAERSKRIEEAVRDFAIDAGQQILTALFAQREEDFGDREKYYEREIELAGDNEKAKKAIEARREQEEEAFKARQKAREKKAALDKIFIDTAANIVRSVLENGGIPWGLPFGALAAAYGAVQAGVVQKLNKGKILIQGPGTETSDSIPALLSKNESVIKADASKASPKLLELINDRKIDDRVLNKVVVANGGSQANFDDTGIIRAINANKVDYAVHGYTIYSGIQAGKNFKRYIKSKVQGY